MSKKRITFAAIGLLLMCFLVIGIWLSLRADNEYEPENNVANFEPKRSQVFVSGNDYVLDTETKRKHEENEERRSDILNEEASSNNNRKAPSQVLVGGDSETAPGNIDPEVIRGGGGESSITPSDPDDNSDPDRDDDEESYYRESEKERKVLPTVKTSLVDGQRFTGKTVSFWVTATDYKKQNIPAGTADNGDGYFKVLINGVRTTAAGGSNTGRTQYRPAAKNGKNIVKIIAVDRRGKKRTITRKIYCDTKKEQVKNNTISLTITAPSVGIGTIASTQVKTYDKEPLSEALKDGFKKLGITGKWKGDYLVGISKKGIAKKAEISDELLEKMRELGYTVKDGKPDRLYEKDFCSASGWVYTVNGDAPDKGLGAYIIEDGDEVVLRFSLYDGDKG